MNTEKTTASSSGTTDPAAPATDATSSEPQRPEEDDWRARDRRVRLIVLGLCALLVFIYLIPDILFRVLPGQAGVVWYLFFGGTDVEYVRPEGLRIKWPFDRAYVYDIRLQQETRTFAALSTDGLPIEIEVSIRFRPHEEALGQLHKHVGPDYVERLILPELGAHVRERISRHRPDELYGQRREEIQTQIRDQIVTELRLDYEHEEAPEKEPEIVIHVEDVLIRNIVLPAEVAAAIDSKLAQEQQMLEYDYVLQKEDKERQRKEIEARGIRAFQDIVTGGISTPYLKWKGIDATLELARSANAKIVVIGTGEDGLPIILGGLDSLPTVAPATTGAAAAPAAATGPSSAAAPASTAPPTEVPPP